MQDAVVECLVKRKTTILSIVIKWLVIMFDISLGVLAIFILLFMAGYIAFVFAFVGVGWGVTWLAFRYTSVEYEYSYFQGELTVDKIYNKSKRKRIKVVNLAKVERFARVGLNTGDEQSGKNRKCFDCADGDPDTEDYLISITEEKEMPYTLRFTPSEDMLEVLKKKYSRKFF